MQNDSYIYKAEVSTGFSNGNLFIYNDAVEYVSNNGKKRKKIFFSEMSGITRKYSDSIEVEYQNNKIELFIFEKETVEKWYEILLKCKEQGNVELKDVEPMLPVEKHQEPPPFEIEVLNKNGVIKGILTIIIGGLLIGGVVSIYLWKIVGSLIMIVSIIKGIRDIVTAKTQVYRATCPYCKHEFYFPVDDLNASCPQCNKMIIIKDNEFQIVE